MAVKLGTLVLGIPAYSALLNDADARLARMKKILDRYRGRFRSLSRAEAESLGLSVWNTMFVPDVRPLGHAATADDVEKGRAVFHLNGKGKLAELQLPAVATLRQRAKFREKSRVLVVQAEIGLDGKTTYGIIGAGDIRAASGDELADMRPVAQKRRSAKS